MRDECSFHLGTENPRVGGSIPPLAITLIYDRRAAIVRLHAGIICGSREVIGALVGRTAVRPRSNLSAVHHARQC
jgi:hypothetical protein